MRLLRLIALADAPAPGSAGTPPFVSVPVLSAHT
jgi:hypothetical protein